MRTSISVFLLCLCVMAGAQNAAPKKTKAPKPAPEAKADQVSAAFKGVAIDTLSCLDALDDVVLAKGSVFATQSAKCKELVSKSEMTAANKRERNVATDLGTMHISLGTCRGYAELRKTDDLDNCLKENHALRDTVMQEADLGTKSQ